MKSPTAIEVAEELHFLFQSATDVYENNPDQAVFTLDSVIYLLKLFGHPEPDFEARGLKVTAGSDAAAHRALMRKVGKIIEKAMKDKKITQAQLAKITGKPASEINRWTSGTANLGLATIYQIEKHLGIKLLNL